jgi:hypothetical protein
MAIHRRLRKAARAALAPIRRAREALERRRRWERRHTQRVPRDRDVDERLAAVAVEVKAGRFTEQPWHSFKAAYFPGLDDDEIADLLDYWCRRHGIEPSLREGKTELGGELCNVLWLMLRPK